MVKSPAVKKVTKVTLGDWSVRLEHTISLLEMQAAACESEHNQELFELKAEAYQELLDAVEKAMSDIEEIGEC